MLNECKQHQDGEINIMQEGIAIGIKKVAMQLLRESKEKGRYDKETWWLNEKGQLAVTYKRCYRRISKYSSIEGYKRKKNVKKKDKKAI